MALDSDSQINLNLLNAIEKNEHVTQRDLAQTLGVALGLANSYLKRCVKKGLIKVKHAPANRYHYYMTPKGLSEKSRLTAEFLHQSFNFYRVSRQQIGDILDGLYDDRVVRIGLMGKSDIAEVAILCAAEREISIAAIIDENGAKTTSTFMGIDVFATLDEIPDLDVVLVTDMTAPQASFEKVASLMPSQNIKVPQILGILEHRSKSPKKARL